MIPPTRAAVAACAIPTAETSRVRPLSPAGVLAELARGPCSGSELAARLGVTRAAVWKQVERLRGFGLAIPARAGGGYRLEAPLDLLDAQAIRSLLTPAARARLGDLAVHWQLDSTSSELLRRAATDPRDVLACLAEIQSAGRGRRGRAWRMPLGGGLALSLLKRFDGGMGALAGLSLVAGVAAVQALADCGVGEVGLKWPNDLVARGRKLGGILVEVGGEAMGPCHAVIGVGLDVRLDTGAGEAIDQPWIDLAALVADAPPARNLLAARLLVRLVAALERFAAEGFAAFADAFALHDALRGHAVRVLRSDRIEQGIARGVDARGALLVEGVDGVRAIDSGDVSVRMGA
jgi:BirA family biotin operon repressor/biotin-[acetyl-CoA-carboxylase] ligase